MGTDLRLRAFPEDCELFARSRVDRQIAENMEFFELFILRPGPFSREPDNEPDRYFMEASQQLVQEHSGLLERYFYNKSRSWDRIVYLLSPDRRNPDASRKDDSLIYKAIRGVERLHPEATAGQGRPIMLVPAQDVTTIAEYLCSITPEQLHEHYDPPQMDKRGVYKTFGDEGEETFNVTWSEFTHIRDLYQEAAAHDEAVIVILD